MGWTGSDERVRLRPCLCMWPHLTSKRGVGGLARLLSRKKRKAIEWTQLDLPSRKNDAGGTGKDVLERGTLLGLWKSLATVMLGAQMMDDGNLEQALEIGLERDHHKSL